MAPLLVNQFPPLLGWLLCMLMSMERRPATAERNPIYIYINVYMHTSIVEHKTGGEKSDWKSVYRINDKVGVAGGVVSY